MSHLSPPLFFGSSPLARGKPEHAGRNQRRRGLIPAHAGKTWCASARPQRSRVHPRSRGENAGTTQRPPPLSGSSPLTRGVLHGCRDRDPRVGLIPTHAGKTSLSCWKCCCIGAHPHSRGENSLPYSSIVLWKGSSPLMRGKHFLTYAFIAQIGQTLESPELCVSSESYSPREPAPPATSRNARAASRARSSSPHSRQPTRWSIRSRRGQTPPSE